MIKALRKLRIEGKYLNIIKDIYDKPIAKLTLNSEKLESFPLKSLPFLYNNNKQTEKEYMETIPFTIASKNSNT
jgi:hypothetical protein